MGNYHLSIRGPIQGYQTKEKDLYRKKVWENIRNAFHNHLSDKKVLIFPSNHDREIKVVLDSGVKEENIWACDENAAILASAKWHKEYPKINILGVKLERAIEKLYAKKIKIDIANFDFCSNLCESVFCDVANFIKFIASDYFCYSITILKGRETTVETLLAKMLFKDLKGAADRIKIHSRFVLRENDIVIKELYQSEYKSNTQYMSYGIFKTIKTKALENAVLSVFAENAGQIKKVLKLDTDFFDAKYEAWHHLNARGLVTQKTRRIAEEKQEKIQEKFYEERDKLKEHIESQLRQTEGWKWKGKELDIGRWSNDALRDYMNLMDIKCHRIGV